MFVCQLLVLAPGVPPWDALFPGGLGALGPCGKSEKAWLGFPRAGTLRPEGEAPAIEEGVPASLSDEAAPEPVDPKSVAPCELFP